eukprot:TRINITY_DN6781_c0_g1_i3.p1 TRINITY_DN6781_c0_g1~~TRINITY_DN6781_c0_g1_i3.p1  ORF type:complete len:142 (-),score=5.81 TRINITY_DN6781_c0_g1_i3:55-480(-)
MLWEIVLHVLNIMQNQSYIFIIFFRFTSDHIQFKVLHIIRNQYYLSISHKGALNLSLVLANMAVDVISVVYLVRLDQDWSAWTASMVDFMALTVLLYLLIKYEFPSWRHMFSYAKNTDTKSYDNSNEAQGLLVSDDQVELS